MLVFSCNTTHNEHEFELCTCLGEFLPAAAETVPLRAAQPLRVLHAPRGAYPQLRTLAKEKANSLAYATAVREGVKSAQAAKKATSQTYTKFV